MLQKILRKILLSDLPMPHQQMKKDLYFYFKYDLIHAVIIAAALSTLLATGHQPLVATLDASWFWKFPIVFYFLFMGHVLIHNAVHGSFPKLINRIVGEVIGWVVLTRFTAWQIVHFRHHVYSDDRERDPHPLLKSYWKYVWLTIHTVDRQHKNSFLEAHADVPNIQQISRWRGRSSYGTNLMLIATWYVLLGPYGFFAYFLPGSILSGLWLIHFNWCTHNAEQAKTMDDFKPVDLTGPFYALGNWVFCGIYTHGYHHKYPKVFNPYLAVRARQKEQVPQPIVLETANRSTSTEDLPPEPMVGSDRP